MELVTWGRPTVTIRRNSLTCCTLGPCPPHHQAGPAPTSFLLPEVCHTSRHHWCRVSRPLMIPKWFGWAQGAGSSMAQSTVNGQRLTRSDRAIGILTSSYPGCPTGTKCIGGLGAEIGGGEGLVDGGVFSPPHPHGYDPPYLPHLGSKSSALKCSGCSATCHFQKRLCRRQQQAPWTPTAPLSAVGGSDLHSGQGRGLTGALKATSSPHAQAPGWLTSSPSSPPSPIRWGLVCGAMGGWPHTQLGACQTPHHLGHAEC